MLQVRALESERLGSIEPNIEAHVEAAVRRILKRGGGGGDAACELIASLACSPPGETREYPGR